MKIFILSVLSLICFGKVKSQAIWVEIKSMPQSFTQIYGEDSLYNIMTKGVIDSCNSYHSKVYHFTNDVRILNFGETVPSDEFRLLVWLSDSIAKGKSGFFYGCELFEKDQSLLAIKGFTPLENTSEQKILAELFRTARIVLGISISKDINTKPHNINETQRDSLNLGENFRNVVVSFKAAEDVEDSVFHFIKNQLTNEWNLTQIKIWRHASGSLSKYAYFNLYYRDENNQKEIIDLRNFMKVTYTVRPKDKQTYVLERKVSGQGIENASVDEPEEINLIEFGKYPFYTTSDIGSSYILMKDLFNLW
ncbi:MAG: hypothetical protein NW226_12835 [Microscillaceae bacterium]|nr:hypothetical protein [Microscillaceae bacterium]